ncbi:streptogramin lyase [Moorella thermoacetica Y72]|uniref:Streptogramin lyase n=1 Tax=Moorella thermoacetica Y72 TaxID=1325331 RepID=A0A0S6UAL1_NEOTH|nr:streptogramin lyase [Moorella thermoacetica Y72]
MICICSLGWRMLLRPQMALGYQTWPSILLAGRRWLDAQSPSASIPQPFASACNFHSTSAGVSTGAALGQLGQGLFHFFRFRGFAVPAGLVFHEGHAFAFDGFRDDDRGFALDLPGPLQGVQDLAEVMAVDGHDFPAEGAELVGHRLRGHDLLHSPVDLQVVVVDDGRQVIQAIMGRGHGPFPHHAFLQLAVPQEDVNTVIPAVQAPGQGHTVGHRQTVAQGTGGNLHPRQGFAVRVPLQGAAQPPQGIQLIHGKEAPFRQGGVKNRGRVALGKNEAVPLRPVRPLRVQAHDLKIKGCHDLHRRQGPAGVAGAGRTNHPDDVPANPPGRSHKAL